MGKWIAIFCLFLYISAASQNGKELYFQPSFAQGASASKMFEEVKYIPLQTTKKSLFGRIRELIVSDAYFIIWDTDTNSIYFFDKNGKFVKKFRPHKCIIKTIQLDRKRNALFISGFNKHFNFSRAEVEKMMSDPTNKSFARYTWSGYYDLSDIHKEKVEVIKDFSLALVTPTIFDNWWAYSFIYANRRWNEDTDYELKIYDGTKTIKQYFPYNKKSGAIYYNPGKISFFPVEDNEMLLFTRPYDYSIYTLTKDSVSLLYKFILPLENSLPKSFFEMPFRSKNDFDEYKYKNGSLVWGLRNVYKMGNYLFFSLDYNKSYREKHFMYDEGTKRFYNMGRVSTDSSTAYLPLLQNGIQYCDNEYLYTSISSSTMFQTRDNTQRRSPQYTPEIKEYFDKGDRTDNPVIIQLKLKNKIG